VSLSSAIACSMDLKAMLGVALDHVLNLLSADRGGILVYAIEGESPPVFAFRGLADEEMMRFVQDARRPQDRLEIRRTQCKEADVLCVPIGTAERVLGDMFVCCPHKHWLSDTGLQLLVSIGSQLAVAIENARLYEAVRRKEEDISSFLRKYIAAQEDERKRIARELHDDTAQSLTALAMAIETAVQTPTDSAAEIRALLEPARSLTDRISTEVSRIIRDLRPSLLDDLGLLEALGWYADNRLKPLGIQVTFETVGEGRRLSPELETGLFRVAQEAMSNIARHAEAENASITLEYGDDYVALAVEDDGCGFDVEATLAKGKDGRDDSPFGLLGMRERVELMGGTLLVQSRPNQGTSITVRVPLAQT
jgi:signal transduction histidine kinase